MTLTANPTRARLGVIVPSVNTVVEPWFSALAPPGVTIHAAGVEDHIGGYGVLLSEH